MTPILKNFHWLPVILDIDLKLSSLAFCCVNGTVPNICLTSTYYTLLSLRALSF